MKNNYRIINFLRNLFRLLFVLITLKLAAGVCLNIICVFFPSFPISAGGIHFYAESFLKTDISYQLLGSDVFSGQSEVVLRMKEIDSDSFIYRIIRLVDFTIINVLTYFLLKKASSLFTNLAHTYKTSNNFSWDNYRILKRIGFLQLGLWSYGVINGLLFSGILMKDVLVQGVSANFHPALLELPGLISVLIIFVFAEVYRSGIVMQDEAEFTI